MSWFLSVLIGHILNALGFVLNKAALNVAVKNAGAFTFWVGVLGLISVALLPFGFFVPQGIQEWWSLIAGGVGFIGALLCFMYALSSSDTSKVAPFIGALIPIFTYLFEDLFIGKPLTGTLLIAFIVLVVGTVVITIDLDVKKSGDTQNGIQMPSWLPWVLGVVAAALFGLSFVASKVAYDTQPFWGAFSYMRIVSFVAVLPLLSITVIRKEVARSSRIFFTKNGLVYLSSQVVGGVAFIFINFALSQASATIVNALQGIQYAFLIMLVWLGHIFAPRLVQEAMGRKTLFVRSLGVVVIMIGIALVSFGSK